ncbi:MAG: FtsX-like permease family protein [Rhodospirillales bacterium]|nr:FtsX-like permease family protein [Rhodospirillales bacterium]
MSLSLLAPAARLMVREFRGGLAGFRIFLACLALGVAAIAAVGTVSSAILGGLKGDARALLGGDVALGLVQRTLTGDEAAAIAATTAAMSTVVELRAMVRAASGTDARTMVEVKAVDAGYPLVGAVENDPPLPLADALAPQDDVWGALVDPPLLGKLGVAVGDRIRLGEATLQVRGAVVREPDRVASVISFGPRLMIAAEALAATGLVQPGSIVRYETRAVLPPGASVKDWTAAINGRFPTAGWRVRDTDGAAPGVRRFVNRLGMFLSFAGMAALLIGGLGVANAVRQYLDGKVATIATLKCLGAPGALVFVTYLMQILVLAVLGIALGLVLGAALPIIAFEFLGDILPVQVEAGIQIKPLAKAAGLGLLTAVTFALWPLGRARTVPAGDLFRQAAAGATGRPSRVIIAAAAAAALALAVMTVLSTPDRWFGVWFVGGAVLTLLLLRASAWIVVRAAGWLPRARSAVVRMAVANLRRPGAPAPQVMMSLGAGLTVLVAIGLIDSNLRAQIGERLPEMVPAVFFIDIQNEQAAAFDAEVRAIDGIDKLERVPSVRGSIRRINGVPVDEANVAPGSQWAVRGDRALTYAAAKPEDAEIVAGAWWPEGYAGPPLVSFDAGLAEGFGVGVGDTLTLNILGREITAEIASLREIDWRAVPFDFALIFAPGLLEGAPHTHIAAVYAPPESEDQLERRITDRFANITAIRTREALEAVNGMIERIGLGVRSAAAVTIVAGALVLAGAVAADRHRRAYEAVLFKVLGASRRRIAGLYLAEYGLLALVTAIAAAVLGSLIGWAVAVLLMDLEWRFDPGVVVTTTIACIALTLAVGFLGTWRHLGRKAAPYLRND